MMPMRKRQQAPAKVRQASDAIEQVRARFIALVNPPSRKEFAQQFMRAYHLWAATVDGDTSFAAFVRLLIPTVPHGSTRYLRDPIYQHADYLRKLAQR